MSDQHKNSDQIRIQTADFDLGLELTALRAGDARVGALASFVGLVRDRNEGEKVSEMTLEHYPGMTEKSLEKIVQTARKRWELMQTLIIHRVGTLQAMEQIVLVAVSSAHRGGAFAACEFIMDYLKTEAPFWKREVTSSGERWVDARESDTSALARWQL